MLPYKHIFLGAIFSYVIFLLFPQIEVLGFLIIFFSSFLIDVDHYIYYACKKKDFSLKRAVKWFFKNRDILLNYSSKKRKEFYTGIYFLHGIEILVVLGLLIFVSEYFLYVLIGFLFHIISDIIYLILTKNRISKISLISDFLKSKKLKLVGEEKQNQ
ncbi:MAG: hypothetical protein ACOCUU_03780 [Nanoarchaeota archaeon]